MLDTATTSITAFSRNGLSLFKVLLGISLVVGVHGTAYSTTFVVSNLNSSGPGSFAQAITDANGSAGADTIDVTGVTGTVLLNSTLPAINSDMLILGPVSGTFELNGQDSYQIMQVNSGTVTIRRIVFSNGSMSSLMGGAAIENAGATLTLEYCEVKDSHNTTATSGNRYGGGILSEGDLTMTHCYIHDNSCSVPDLASPGNQGGGGLYIDGYSNVIISHCLFEGNSLNGGTNKNGAAIAYADNSNFSGIPGSLLIEHTTISGNSINNGTNNDGAGISIENFENSVITVNHCTITNNVTQGGTNNNGAGFYDNVFSLEANMFATIVQGNSPSDIETFDLNSQGYNIFGDNFVFFTTHVTDLVNTDALLLALDDNGGATKTHALDCGSPAFDLATGSTMTSDQRDSAVFGVPDAGAFERQFPDPSANISGTAVVCPSGSQVGSILVEFEGVAPFTVTLGPVGNLQTFTTVDTLLEITPWVDGVYTIVGFSDANCSETGSGSALGVISDLAATISTTPASCGLDNGSATVTPSGGSSPYDIAWTSGDSTALSDDLAAGLYQVTVTDDIGCVVTATATVSNADITLSHTFTEPSCNGSTDGSIDLSVTGASPFSYYWTTGAITQDISGLPAGTYDVEVTDANGCVATASIIVGEPDALVLTGLEEMATCGAADGLAAVYPTGGTVPYTFQWFDDQGPLVTATDDSLTNAAAGSYYVLVEDANGCQGIFNVVIGETGGPTITLLSTTQPGCATLGDITIDVPGSIDSLRWNTGETTSTISGLEADYYTVRVYENGCMSMLGVDLQSTVPSGADICLVTVDFFTFTNKVVWNKQVSSEISHYNIYRETSQLGQFLLVGSRPYDSLSNYTDPVANPTTRSWRYKVSLVDTCGNESALSPYHKTIHLTKSLAVSPPGAINLIWDDYEGFTYNQFRIWRYSDIDGWNAIDSVTSATHLYTDTAVPVGWTQLDYFIEVDAPGTCLAERAENYNSSRSNKTEPGIATPPVGILENRKESLTVFPNPANDAFYVRLSGAEGNKDIMVLDPQGRIVKKLESAQETSRLDVSTWAPGTYFVVVQTNRGFMRKAVVVQ